MRDKHHDSSHTYDSNAFDDVGDPKAQAERDQRYKEQERIEREQTERQEKLDKLCAKLEKLAGYTEKNSAKEEFKNAQERIKEIKAQIASLTPTAVVEWKGLSDLLDRIVFELHRFLVIAERDAQIVALWIVHCHLFLHEVFDHTPHLIVWSETHQCGSQRCAKSSRASPPTSRPSIQCAVASSLRSCGDRPKTRTMKS